MHKSPWSSYGRTNTQANDASQSDFPDPTFGAAERVERERERLTHYLQRTLREYADIRAGRLGYQTLVADALKPSPRPESVEERLRRLTGE